jgi:cell division protein ZapA (FtsZ GTPase activity inhibitor)
VGKEVEVIILGNKYSFITDKNPEEALKIAAFVDELGKKIKEEEPYSSENTIAILTALNIADKYFALADEIEKLKRYIGDLE